MALHYNLAKVYEQSAGNPETVLQLIAQFVTVTPDFVEEIKLAIKEIDHKKARIFACKLKPLLDLLGLKVAFEEVLQVEAWAKIEGKPKEIKETYRSIKKQVKWAVKELKKDFALTK
jgi:HPt (histidine-containing phosphotransfer) domain-containing protein